MKPRLRALGIAVLALTWVGACTSTRPTEAASSSGEPFVKAVSDTAAGRYLVQVGGCNDCHTPGWLQKPGSVPEAQWLTGISMGFRGPWGTTYPKNLRRIVQTMTADQWVQLVKRPDFAKPPMPVYDLNHMSDTDLRAIYTYVRSLGPAGDTVPADVPPGQEPRTPYVPFAPPAMPGGSAPSHGR